MEDNNGNAPQKEQLNEEAERQISEIEEKVAKKKSGFWKEVKEWVVALVVALLVVFVIQTFLFRIIRVDGHSMDTTLADGERLFVTVTDVKFGSVQRDSVVICHYPNRYNNFLGFIPMQTYFVKRVVAVPGDTVYRKNEVTHVVYEKDGQTVDEMLVYIPQLSERKRKLTQMASFLPKERVSNGYQSTKIIEYTYTNYDLQQAADDLAKVSDELAKAQTALDVINNQGQLELEI